MREIAYGLCGRGWDVEVLTTCAVDHYTWENDSAEGTSVEEGITVRRFPTVPSHCPPGLRTERAISAGQRPSVDDQWTWVGWRFTVPALFEYLLRHGSEYQAVVFSPYLFWNTTACLSAVAGNAVVMPCLHDESYARLDVIRPVLASPRSVWFLSEPEHDLAHALGPVADRHTVTGAGLHPPAAYDPDGFRARHAIRRPFILYAGRREKGKGWEWLLDVFGDAVEAGLTSVDLVTIGVGEVEVPARIMGRVVDLGFLAEADRNDAFAAATACVQPSKMESFSRTVMESWLAGTPVLAVEGSDVVDWHCRRSGAGFVFRDGMELRRHVEHLLERPDEAERMAAAGRSYVLDNYSWEVVLDRMEADLDTLAGS